MKNKYYTDGSGWSGTRSGWCVYEEKDESVKIFMHIVYEKFTNNEMEYRAFIEGAKMANTGDEILADSELVIKQLKGEYKVKSPNLKELYKEAHHIYSTKNLTIGHTLRDGNKAGVVLEGALTKL